MDKQHITEFFLRLPIAISVLGHGLVLLPKLELFALRMAEQFASTLLLCGFHSAQKIAQEARA